METKKIQNMGSSIRALTKRQQQRVPLCGRVVVLLSISTKIPRSNYSIRPLTVILERTVN